MNPKRILLAAMAAGAVALFVEPAAAESTLRAATGWITDPYCYFTPCESTYPAPSDETIVDTIVTVGETIGDWLGF